MRFDAKTFLKNRSAFPLEELVKYEGHWVAWSPDGAAILASSSVSEDALDDLVRAAGQDPSECVMSYVPGPDETFLGKL